MTIRHFRIFIAVANMESITRAAQALYVSQPTVSVAIRELEQHYGTRLFERISQRLKITEAGRALLGYATHLISLYDEMEATFQNPDSHGLLRVGASVTFGVYGMPALAADFRARFPHIRLEVTVDTTDEVEKRLLENEVDAAIVAGVVRSRFITPHPAVHRAACRPVRARAPHGRAHCAAGAVHGSADGAAPAQLGRVPAFQRRSSASGLYASPRVGVRIASGHSGRCGPGPRRHRASQPAGRARPCRRAVGQHPGAGASLCTAPCAWPCTNRSSSRPHWAISWPWPAPWRCSRMPDARHSLPRWQPKALLPRQEGF